jgi:hypothetical protein
VVNSYVWEGVAGSSLTPSKLKSTRSSLLNRSIDRFFRAIGAHCNIRSYIRSFEENIIDNAYGCSNVLAISR